jgi:hypothetical protein
VHDRVELGFIGESFTEGAIQALCDVLDGDLVVKRDVVSKVDVNSLDSACYEGIAEGFEIQACG